MGKMGQRLPKPENSKTEEQGRGRQSEGRQSRRNSKTEKQEKDGENNSGRGNRSSESGPCGGDKEAIIQNLRDAGCDEKTCTSVACDLTEGRTKEGLEALKQHRRELLDHVHKGQKCIDCLDYLVYQVKKDRQDT